MLVTTQIAKITVNNEEKEAIQSLLRIIAQASDMLDLSEIIEGLGENDKFFLNSHQPNFMQTLPQRLDDVLFNFPDLRKPERD